ncbi:MAG TPA: N-acetylmuramidase domain-containing protein [Flavipsychrobacter sp.]|nr:N-acetylmuramidase domain-containing protein [Flavipsychrobacter sp.]
MTATEEKKIPGITFKEHYKLTGLELVITSVNISRRPVFYLSFKTTPNLRIADAVRMSMSIPGFFKPVHITEEQVTKGSFTAFEKKILPGYWIDGGVINNNPIHAFDTRDNGDRLRSYQSGKLNKNLFGVRLGKEIKENITAPNGDVYEVNTRKDPSRIGEYVNTVVNTIIGKKLVTANEIIGEDNSKLSIEYVFDFERNLISPYYYLTNQETSNNQKIDYSKLLPACTESVQIVTHLNNQSITQKDFIKLSAELAVEPEALMAIGEQESKDAPFYENRPTILFEPRWFYKLLKSEMKMPEEQIDQLIKKYENVNLINKSTRKNSGMTRSKYYGIRQLQYDKLDIAKTIFKKGAIECCSWGRFQVMGFNYKMLYNTIDEFEKAMYDEFEQFRIFAEYLKKKSGLLTALRQKNWTLVAEKYNGSEWQSENPEYADNLKTYYEQFKKTGL